MEEYLVPAIVILARLLIPFSILKWPFAGAVASALADGADIMIFEKFGIGKLEWERYHTMDKILDIYYLSFLMFVAWRWEHTLLKRLALGLFVWRLLGVIFFEATQWRATFLFTPNVFENFYFAILFIKKFLPRFPLSLKQIFVILILVAIPKLIQEYIMHYIEFPVWLWIKEHFFFFLY